MADQGSPSEPRSLDENPDQPQEEPELPDPVSDTPCLNAQSSQLPFEAHPHLTMVTTRSTFPHAGPKS